MIKEKKNMICKFCKDGELIEGTLEGVSFEPAMQSKKIFSKGVYGIRVLVCSNCGQLSDLKLDLEALKKVTE
jgi:hypothetical protein